MLQVEPTWLEGVSWGSVVGRSISATLLMSGSFSGGLPAGGSALVLQHKMLTQHTFHADVVILQQQKGVLKTVQLSLQGVAMVMVLLW